MRIIFAGTPDFAASHLQALLDAKLDIVAVYTQPDRPAGRGKKLTASAVKQLALEHNLPVLQPKSLKSDDALASLQSLLPDLMVVVAYGLILPKAILNAPTHGCINVHGSILPKWRGAAPIQRAIWAGDSETGVSIMQMDEGLDTGDTLAIEKINIAPDDTSASLYLKLAELGPKALVRSVQNFTQLVAKKQDDAQATYAAKLSKTEAYLDWHLPAKQLAQNVLAFNPWPVAWFSFQGVNTNAPIKVWKAYAEEFSKDQACNNIKAGEVLAYNKQGLSIATSDGVLVIEKLQLAGKKPQALEQLVNGQAELFSIGDVLP